MRLAQTGQQLADLQHVFRQAEVAVGAQTLQIDQAVAGAVGALGHKGVGLLDVTGMLQHFAVHALHLSRDAGQRFVPAVIIAGVGKMRIDARLAGFFMLQQQVRDPAKGGDHEDAPVDVRALTGTDKERILELVHAGHGRPADFFDSVGRLGHMNYATSSAGA